MSRQALQAVATSEAAHGFPSDYAAGALGVFGGADGTAGGAGEEPRRTLLAAAARDLILSL